MPATRKQLRERILRKRKARQSYAADLVRLQDAMTAELAAAVEAAQRARARDRRDPGSRQRELELDE